MASKVSYAQDEILIPCDMCSKSESATSYCKECFIHICDDCKQQHLKHTSTPVLEGLLEKLHLVNCSKHQQRYTHYCISCEVNICERCLNLDHRGHGIESVGTQGKKLRNKFSEKIKSKKSEVTKIKDFMSRITKHEQYFKDHSNKQIKKVWSKIRERKEMLDAEGERITESVELEQKEASEKLKNQSKELQDLHIKLTNLTDSLENQLSNIPDEAVLKFVNKNKTKLEENLPKFELPEPSEFTWDLKLLGSLSSDPPEQLNIKLEPSSLRQELEVVGKFKPTGSAVRSICATDDGMFWVGTSVSELLLVDKEGGEKLRLELPGIPWYTSITGPGDVIVSTLKHVIYKVTRQSQIIEFIDVSPDKVYGVTSTQEGDLFACVQSTSLYTWEVQKFSSEGKFLFELDSTMFKPFNALRCVHAVLDDVVCVQDGYPVFDTDCYLTFVTASGQVKPRVKRTGKLRDDTKYIVWDDHDNMLTATWKDEYIHVFSWEGVFKQSYKVGESKLLWTLCLGKDGVMAIGTRDGDVIIANYLQ